MERVVIYMSDTSGFSETWLEEDLFYFCRFYSYDNN